MRLTDFGADEANPLTPQGFTTSIQFFWDTTPNTTHYVDLDVHKDTIAIAVADPGRGDPESQAYPTQRFHNSYESPEKAGRSRSVKVLYEAGPTGYVLYRQLKAAGVPCVVIAPSLVPVQTGRRIKTDRRDAAKLAGYLRSGDLTPIHVPDEAIEAIRDLERAHDDAQRRERVTRHHRSKFLLRHGRIDTGKTNWGQAHLAWIARQTFDQRASMQVLSDYREAVE